MCFEVSLASGALISLVATILGLGAPALARGLPESFTAVYVVELLCGITIEALAFAQGTIAPLVSGFLVSIICGFVFGLLDWRNTLFLTIMAPVTYVCGALIGVLMISMTRLPKASLAAPANAVNQLVGLLGISCY